MNFHPMPTLLRDDEGKEFAHVTEANDLGKLMDTMRSASYTPPARLSNTGLLAFVNKRWWMVYSNGLRPGERPTSYTPPEMYWSYAKLIKLELEFGCESLSN